MSTTKSSSGIRLSSKTRCCFDDMLMKMLLYWMNSSLLFLAGEQVTNFDDDVVIWHSMRPWTLKSDQCDDHSILMFDESPTTTQTCSHANLFIKKIQFYEEDGPSILTRKLSV
ncbi:hypothetical protein Tco_0335371 [Tanacetum coccineum]